MLEFFKRVLDKLEGADLWIALTFLAAGTICWLWIGTKKPEQRVLGRQIAAAFVVALVAGAAIFVNHAFFQRERAGSRSPSTVLWRSPTSAPKCAF
jgi:hypothetical protein